MRKLYLEKDVLNDKQLVGKRGITDQIISAVKMISDKTRHWQISLFIIEALEISLYGEDETAEFSRIMLISVVTIFLVLLVRGSNCLTRTPPLFVPVASNPSVFVSKYPLMQCCIPASGGILSMICIY